MAKLYSDTQLRPLTIEDEDGTIRVYKGFKLNAFNILNESFKMLKTLAPSIGTVADSMSNKDDEDLYSTPTTWTAAMQMLENNLSELHFADLVEKLTGNLICNGNAIDDWDKHFDKYIYDLPDILVWTWRENFADFFTRNHLVRSKMKTFKEKMNPKVAAVISALAESNDFKIQDINEESGKDI